MLVLHRSPHVPVSHRPHHCCEVAAVGEHASSIIVHNTRRGPQTIEPSSEQAGIVCQYPSDGHTSLASTETTNLFPSCDPGSKQCVDPITHRNHSSSLRRLTVGHKDETVAPVEIFGANAVRISVRPMHLFGQNLIMITTSNSSLKRSRLPNQ